MLLEAAVRQEEGKGQPQYGVLRYVAGQAA
jgi:hypothetical protein